MTMWLLVILLVAALGALVWRSDRRRRSIHGSGGGSRGMSARAERARAHDESKLF